MPQLIGRAVRSGQRHRPEHIIGIRPLRSNGRDYVAKVINYPHGVRTLTEDDGATDCLICRLEYYDQVVALKLHVRNLQALFRAGAEPGRAAERDQFPLSIIGPRAERANLASATQKWPASELERQGGGIIRVDVKLSKRNCNSSCDTSYTSRHHRIPGSYYVASRI